MVRFRDVLTLARSGSEEAEMLCIPSYTLRASVQSGRVQYSHIPKLGQMARERRATPYPCLGFGLVFFTAHGGAGVNNPR